VLLDVFFKDREMFKGHYLTEYEIEDLREIVELDNRLRGATRETYRSFGNSHIARVIRGCLACERRKNLAKFRRYLTEVGGRRGFIPDYITPGNISERVAGWQA